MHWTLIGLVFFGMLWESVGQPTIPTETKTDVYRNENYDTAIHQYRSALASNPANVDLRRDLMWVLWRAQRFESCADIAQSVLEYKEDDLEALNLVGRCLQMLGRSREALVAYDRSLSIQPDQPTVRWARVDLLETLRDYEAALQELKTLRRQQVEPRSAVKLARLLRLVERYEEEAEAWAEAEKFFLDEPDYAFRRAEALFRAGHGERAKKLMRELLDSHPDNELARDFLVRCAIVAGDLDGAIALIEEAPLSGDKRAASRVRLAALYVRADQPALALQRLDEALAIEPDHGEALLSKANLLRPQQPQQAAALYEQVAKTNPCCLRAWIGLSGALLSAGQPTSAVRAIRFARAVDPTNPQLCLQEAQYRYKAGEREESRRMLEQWLQQNHGPALAVLLYHGLSVTTNDPMLAARIHVPVTVFEEHMRALREAGYTAVGAMQIQAWLTGKDELPVKPVWITFDDGRLDSLREATPILKKYGLTAAMFVSGYSADRNLPGYATWEELAGFLQSGVWEMQSHGDLAALRVSVNSEERKELFLVGRQWLAEQNRLENEEEWLARLEEDYRNGADKMEEKLGVRPVAFAWPEGNFGQEGIPNVPHSAERNIELVRRHYALALHQDGLGLNLRTRDPAWLSRAEPPADWSGQDLLRHLSDQNPLALVTLQLLDQVVWENDTTNALRWLDKFRQFEITESSLCLAEAKVFTLSKDYEKAITSAQRALALAVHSETTNKPVYREACNALAMAWHGQGRYRTAIETYLESLKEQRDQPFIWIALAQAFEDSRDYPRALKVVNQIRSAYPDMTRVIPQQARLLGLTEQYEEAADAWAEALKTFPDRTDYAFRQAEALFRAGRVEQAKMLMREILRSHPDHERTRDFLVSCALVAGDLNGAIALLEQGPRPARDPTGPLVRVASLYMKEGELEAALERLDEALAIEPGHGEALLSKADLLRPQQPQQAAALYERVAETNPCCLRAWIGLSGALLSAGQPTSAVRAIRCARAVDPTNPQLCLQEAQCRYKAGEREESRQMLEQWLQQNHGSALAVLLYHGLSVTTNDPMLAARIHVPVTVFEEHMRALREAGYTAVDATQIQAWLAGKGELSIKPVWIVFDDGRLDSLREATPILKKYGLTAAMFVSGYSADRNLPGYATWEELAGFLQSGVWEMQSHGDLAALRVSVNSEERKELFLVGRQWLAEQNRLENEEEWLARLEEDYRNGADKMEEKLGMRPMAFAWPEGNFGQEGIPNAPHSAERNIELVRRHYALAFHQDRLGLNLRTRDPAWLSRVEPPAEWSGQDLLRHLSDQNPCAQVTLELLKQSAWESRWLAGEHWLAELQEQGVSTARYLVARAILENAAGHWLNARQLAEQALLEAPLKDAESLLASILQRERPGVKTSVQIWDDNDRRRNVIAEVEHESACLKNGRLTLGLRTGDYREDGVSSIREVAPSAGMRWPMGFRNEFSIEAAGHALDGLENHLFTGSAMWRARWSDELDTRLMVGRFPVYTVGALAEQIRSDQISAELQWQPDLLWRLRLRGIQSELTDDNERSTFLAEIARQWTQHPGVRALYQFTFDDMTEDRPEYYCPQKLRLHRVGFEYTTDLNSRLSGRLRYLPGYGQEKDKESRFVQSADIEFSWKLTSGAELRPQFNLQRTPSYQSISAGLSWSFRY